MYFAVDKSRLASSYFYWFFVFGVLLTDHCWSTLVW